GSMFAVKLEPPQLHGLSEDWPPRGLFVAQRSQLFDQHAAAEDDPPALNLSCADFLRQQFAAGGKFVDPLHLAEKPAELFQPPYAPVLFGGGDQTVKFDLVFIGQAAEKFMLQAQRQRHVLITAEFALRNQAVERAAQVVHLGVTIAQNALLMCLSKNFQRPEGVVTAPTGLDIVAVFDLLAA